MRLPGVELEVSWQCSSKERINHILKSDGDKSFKNLRTNKILSKKILSENLKLELCLKRGLVWEFLGWKLIIVTVFL